MSIVFKYLVDTKVRYFLEIVEKKQTSSVGRGGYYSKMSNFGPPA